MALYFLTFLNRGGIQLEVLRYDTTHTSEHKHGTNYTPEYRHDIM